MRQIAKVENGIVINISLIDTDTIPSGFIDVTGIVCGPGWSYTGGVFYPPIDKARSYTLVEFIDALTEDELGILLELVTQEPGSVTLTSGVSTKAQHRSARRTWERWRASNNIDFNEQTTVSAVTWLVNNTDEWTPSRANTLAKK